MLLDIESAARRWARPEQEGAWSKRLSLAANRLQPTTGGQVSRPFSVRGLGAGWGPEGGGEEAQGPVTSRSLHKGLLGLPKPQSQPLLQTCGLSDWFSNRKNARALEEQMSWVWLPPMEPRHCLLQVTLVWMRNKGQAALHSRFPTALPIID